jgi:hypothetical protein
MGRLAEASYLIPDAGYRKEEEGDGVTWGLREGRFRKLEFGRRKWER